MVKLELNIDTSEAMKKIKALTAKAEQLGSAMALAKSAAEDTAKAMRDLVDALSRIDVKLDDKAGHE